ncbi:type II secretion system protein GspL [Hellea balneolensis]|uniref:type II secretion system protein GspL n=1 Tax=Hellea balneolensis TaxID=287478 RepID=UPI00041185AE|nr:type II secretion system protein GspL [Hellea balneolensis]
MTERLIIVMPSHANGLGLWGLVDGDNVLRHGRDTPTAMNAKEVVAILPGQSVRIYAHELPVTSKRDRLRAAGFSIEDKIAVPLDKVHIALSDDRIAVIDKDTFTESLAQLKDVGISPSRTIADFEALSELDGNITLLDRAVTTGPLGHAVDMSWEERSAAHPDKTLLSAIGARLEQGETLNLLQNAFSPKSGFNFGWRQFAPLGGIAAALGIMALVFHGVEARALKLQAADLKTQTAQLFTQATGQAAPNNPALAATRAMKSGGEDNLDFLRLSQTLFAGVEQIEGLTVEQLRYQESKTELQLRLIYPSFESAGQFENAIRSLGGQLITGGVREQSGRFVGEATLRGGAS